MELMAAISFAGGLVLLYLGGESLVTGAAALGRRVGMTPLVAGLTIVAFATSAPELAVCVRAALNGAHGLALGNVVGSNICNLALILGLTAVVRPAELGERFVRRDVPIMIGSTILVLVLLLPDERLSRVDGAILSGAIVLYLLLELRRARERRGRSLGVFPDEPQRGHRSIMVNGLLVVGGLALLVWGGDLFVDGAMAVAVDLGVSPAVVGLSVAALGTSLPELVTSLIAARRGYTDMAVGNLVGSSIFNLLSILGVTSLVVPLSRGAVTNTDLAVMLLVTVAVYPLMRTGQRMDRWRGAVLLMTYIGYLSWLVGQSAGGPLLG